MKLSYRKLSVILVDPVPQALDSLRDILNDYQFFRVHTAKGADEALKTLADKAVDFMITGWRMQPMSGFQLVERVRGDARLRELPILMMRERKDRHVEEQGKVLKVQGYINLPLEARTARQEVEKVLATLVDEDEERFLVAMDQARKSSRAEDWGKAAAAYRQALEVRDDEEAQVNLARILLNHEDDPTGAQRAFMAALRLNSSSLRSFLGLAEAYQRQERLEEALKVLISAGKVAKKAAAGGAEQASLLFYTGEVALNLAKLGQAMGCFRKIREHQPDDAEMQVKIGDSLVANDHPEESEEFYKAALEMDPGLAHVYNRLGIAYRRQSKLDQALELYRKALNFHPEDENLHFNIARCQWEMADYHQAAESLIFAMKLNPEFEEAKAMLDLVLKKLGLQGQQPGQPAADP